PQAALFADVMDDWSAVERVADRALQRFGDDAIRPARLLSEPASSTQQSPSQSPDE
ncbi:MAG: DNA polymerase IV, partial [Actinobacteria bacterium]|nr:DNA polymerase IV [Actinomycetota bacterium]